ncbi:MerR family transcriptional regulator [Shimia abyssi]|uniref:MerR-like DNA binding protein n=1 Tax=Shimia abyssi TaxID=1662395 RepID=A0A2P8FIQ4_9RHOB|nr:MerR family transcriptional regulator [Shimia abyssi]PSL21602.1 MerR-like DNA binding protein [Shimia abyssi]
MSKSRDAFRTISEVADWLDTQAHVLRFWESKFSQVKPVKRAGGRRYYRPQDMMLLGGIKKLLHDDGMTIKGAQQLLREKGVKHVSSLSQPIDDDGTIEVAAMPLDTPQNQAAPQIPAEPSEPEVIDAPVTEQPDDALPSDDIPDIADTSEIISDDVDLPTPAINITTPTSPEPEAAIADNDAKDDDTTPPAVEAQKPIISDLFTSVDDAPVPDTSEADAEAAEDIKPAHLGEEENSEDEGQAPVVDPSPTLENVDEEDVAIGPSEVIEPAVVDETELAEQGPSVAADQDEPEESGTDRPADQLEFSRIDFLSKLCTAQKIPLEHRARAAHLVTRLATLRAEFDQSDRG